MAKYVVRYEWEDGVWFVQIPAIPGCHTQGNSLPQARERIRECLGLYDSAADKAELVDQIELPPQISAAIQQLSAFGIQGVDVEILLASHPA